MALHDLYATNKKEEVVVWENDPQHDGFSVLRDYPVNSRFVPVKKPDGTNDTKALIKVGYATNAINEGKVSLFVSVSKFEAYLSGRFTYDFSSPDSPAKDAIDKSNQSPQPIPLEERGRYTYNANTKTFYDVEKKKEVSLNDIVNAIYDLHVKTISDMRGVILKSKLGFQAWVCNVGVRKIEVALLWINNQCFGKILVDDKEDWMDGLLRPFKHSRLTTVYPHTIPFFTSTSQISKAAIAWVSLTVLVGHYFLPDQLALDNVSSIAAVILLVFLFDSWVPHSVLAIVNVLIRFRMWFGDKKFGFK